MKVGERAELIDDLLEGEISEADFLRLEAEMIVNKEARLEYYDRQKLQTGLELEAEEAFRNRPEEGSATASGAKPTKLGIDGILISGMVVVAALMGLIGWKLGQESQQGGGSPEKLVSGFGVIAKESGAVWKEGLVLSEGDLLPAGPLELVSGTVKVELFNGVDIVLSGGSRIEVRSDFDFLFEEGKATFRVPSGVEGVRVETPSGEFLDFGTEFALEITPEFESAAVLSGALEWKVSSGGVKRVEAGEGWRRTTDGKWQEIDQDDLSVAETEQVFAEATEQRHLFWKERLAELNQEERVVALYTMGETDSGSSLLKDQSGSGADGDIIRSTRTVNRWGEPFGGLDFTLTGSRVRVNLGGSFSSLTLICWVKVDSLDRVYNSLFLTDGHEQFEPHWQIMSDGRIFFSVKAHEDGGGRDKHIAFSPSIWSVARSGQWMQLATVFDGQNQTTTHFVNGRVVSMDSIPPEYAVGKVQIGAASIGNWSEPRYRNTSEFAVRNLNGTMDEFILFSTPLGASEIHELYQAGKP